MPGVEDAVPESNFKGCYVENLDLRRPVTGPFAMPRLISNVAWFAERLGTAVSGEGLPKQKGPLFACGLCKCLLV